MQRLEALTQQVAQHQQQFAELQQQLTTALARAQQAETERTQALQLAAAAQQAAALAQQAATTAPLLNQPLLDTKALGQPPKLKRRDALPNWAEWKHKVFTNANAHFKSNGNKVLEAMRWAELQRRKASIETNV